MSPINGFSHAASSRSGTLDAVLRIYAERASERDATPSARDLITPHAGEPERGYDSSVTASGMQAQRIAPRARVYDAATNADLGTVDSIVERTGDVAAAAVNVQKGLDWLATRFGRNGVDNAGAGVDVMVNDRSTDSQGAERFRGNGGFYTMPDAAGVEREAIHFGTGASYETADGVVDQQALQHADDLTIHELVHGVIRAETGHAGGGANEAGATNEALADVLAAAATRDWKLGEGMYTDSSDYRMMRNVADPDDPTAVHGLWTTTDEVRAQRASDGSIEEHWASGVISTAAQRVQARIGGEDGWQVVEQVFYDAIEQDRLGDMSFQEVADALRATAAADYGATSQAAVAFDEELRRAGL